MIIKKFDYMISLITLIIMKNTDIVHYLVDFFNYFLIIVIII